MKTFEIVYVAPPGVTIQDTAKALCRCLFTELPPSVTDPVLCAVFGHGPIEGCGKPHTALRCRTCGTQFQPIN